MLRFGKPGSRLLNQNDGSQDKQKRLICNVYTYKQCFDSQIREDGQCTQFKGNTLSKEYRRTYFNVDIGLRIVVFICYAYDFFKHMKLFKLDFKFCICLRIDVKFTCGEILTK